MRALVTGAAGFIGSRLCARLVAEGHEVLGLDDLSDGSLDNLSDVPEVHLAQVDLRDERAVARAAAGVEVIFHQGAKRAVPRSLEQPGLTNDVNVRGTLNVLLAAREHGGRVVAASSSSVYGDQEALPLRESMAPRPRSPYAASKVAAEAYCSAWWASLRVPTVSLRYFNVYGPGMDPAGQYALVVPRFVVACLTGEPPTIHGDGEQARDFTYIDDALDANLLASRAGEDAFGRAVNVGGGEGPTSINRLLAIIADLSRVRPDPLTEPTRPGDVRVTHADISLANALLGYRPRIGIDEGLARTVAYFRDRPAVGVG